MKFQLLALDLDGTLLEEDLTIPSNTIDRLRRLIQIGVTVTLSKDVPFCQNLCGHDRYIRTFDHI